MGLIDVLYEAASNAGLLQVCVWHPSDGSAAQTHPVGFSCPDESLLDGLTVSTDYAMTYPASRLVGLTPREVVEIDGVTYQVRDVRTVGDGSELRATLTRL